MGSFLLGGQVDPLPSSSSVTCPRFHMAVAMKALIEVANSPRKTTASDGVTTVKAGELLSETWRNLGKPGEIPGETETW